MPKSPIARVLLLAATAMAVLALLELLARLALPSERYYHARLFSHLPAREAARFDALLRSEAKKFEEHYRLGTAQLLDAENFILDPALIYRLAPGLNLKAVNFTLDPEIRETGRWPYTSNTEGWRGPIAQAPRPDERRLLVLGDSTSYGWGLSEEESWPALLADHLGEGWRVYNRAVPGYTTFQGSTLLPGLLEELAPNVVVLGYGADDAMVYPLREEELAARVSGSLGRARSLIERLALPRLLASLLGRLGGTPDPALLTRRVPPEEYASRLLGMGRQTLKAGAQPVLLEICLSDARYRNALWDVATALPADLLEYADTPGAQPTWHRRASGGAGCKTGESASQQAAQRTRQLVGDATRPFFADGCHPTPHGADRLANAMACEVEELTKDAPMSDEAPPAFSLEHTFRRPDERSEGKPPLLLSLHGIGSNERDLAGLQPFLDPRFFLVSVRAPYDYAIPGGYSWFALDITAQGVRIDEIQFRRSRERIVEFLDQAAERYGTDPERVYLLGFSQGSMMSFAVMARAIDKIAGVVAMSGRFVADLIGELPPEEKLRGFPVLVIHGLHDEVLPVQNGRATKEALEKLPVALTYKEYPMGHEVSRESLAEVKRWLGEQLDRK